MPIARIPLPPTSSLRSLHRVIRSAIGRVGSLHDLSASVVRRRRAAFFGVAMIGGIALVSQAIADHPTPAHRWAAAVASAAAIALAGGLVAAMGRTIEHTEREREWASVLASLGESLVVAPDSLTIFGTGLHAAMSLARPSGATGAAVLKLQDGAWEVMQATGALCPSIGKRLDGRVVPAEWCAAGMCELHGDAAATTAGTLGCEGEVDHLLLTFGEAAQQEDATVLAVTSSAPFGQGTRVRLGIVAQQIALAAALDRSRLAVVRTERLAAIGQLAATVSHELRNPLAAIRSAAAFLRRRVGAAQEGDRVREFFDVIDREIAASNRIVGELLDFARTRSLMRAPTDLHRLVEEVRQVVPLGRCRLVNAIPPDFPARMLDRDQIRQVLGNLVQNAGDACPADRQGEVVVRAREGARGSVVLEVEDDGPGMPPDVAARAFEPLFTTKSKGTGLGLALVAKNVDAHGGTIRIEQRDPHGARFVLEIPVPED